MSLAVSPKILVAGRASGVVLRSHMPINFLGTVDRQTGIINDQSHDLYGKSIKDTILVFPSGAGSSVGAYTIYAIKSAGAAPHAMICERPDLTVVTGCAVAGIPLMILASEQNNDTIKSLCTGVHATVDTDALDAIITITPEKDR